MQLLPLSAKSAEALHVLIERYAQRSYTTGDLPDLCYTAQVGRDHYTHRVALVFADAEELAAQLAWLATAPDIVSNEPLGVFYGYHRVIAAGTGAAAASDW